MNLTCAHCGKSLDSNDYHININIRTVMGEALYIKWSNKPFMWEGVNTDYHICDKCYNIITKFIKNESYAKVKKQRKEFNCPDCKLDISTCLGCPRYKI